MATTTAVAARPIGPATWAQLRERPELGAAVAVALAWLTLIVVAIDDVTAGHASHASHLGRADGSAAIVPAWTAVGWWVVMSVAMMGPAALAGVRHTAVNSMWWRRRRAMVEFAAAYLAVWTAFGVVAIGVVDLVPGAASAAGLAIALGIAAAWQLTPAKRRWLRDCHRGRPLAPRGWRAERDAVRFGLANGRACLGSCWCVMLVMVVAPGAHLLWTVALGAVVSAERLLARPRTVTRRASAWFAAGAVVALGVALV